MKRDLSDQATLQQSAIDRRDEGTRVKYGDLAEGLGYVLRRAQLASFKSFQQVFGEAGITPAQFSALLVIELNPGLRQNQVSDALGIKRANFVGLTDKLENRGLVERKPALDRRSYALYLTAHGRKFMQTLHILNDRHEERLRAALTAEQGSMLLDALNAIVNAVELQTVHTAPGDDEA